MAGIQIPPGMSEDEFKRLILDNTRFIPRLTFIDDHGKVQTLKRPYGEQVEILKTLNEHRLVHVLKSRNIGCGTIVQARDFHYGWCAEDPVATVVMAHDDDATRRHLGRYGDYHDSLPEMLKHPLRARNEKMLQYADTKAGYWCFTAGGKGGGKSFTFQRAHFTEMAYYEANAADVYASVKATMHEGGPHYAITIESTSNGPGDFFHAKTIEARRDPEWGFLFFPWFAHRTFSSVLPLHFTPTDEERRLAIRYALRPEQLAWRRKQIREFGLAAFNKYYPATVEEAFLSVGESYFPADWLMELCGDLPEWDKKAYREFFKSDAPRQAYVIGVDAGHGLKKDYSVIQVCNHIGQQVATWSDNVTPPYLVGEKACEIGLRYGKALLCFEAMGPGLEAQERARALGYDNLYGDKGRLGFNTSRQSKEAAFGHARREMIDRTVDLRDRPTCEELVNIRQDHQGRIGGSQGHHDDHAMAWVLARWAARRIDFKSSPMETMKERFGLGTKRLRDTIGWS